MLAAFIGVQDIVGILAFDRHDGELSMTA